MLQIVFDTNAYRSLVQGKPMDQVRRELAAITGAEESKGFQVFMAPGPWIELFSHLVDLSDPAFDTCLKAVVASYIHSRLDARTGRGKLMPQRETLVAYAVFGYRHDESVNSLYALDDLARLIDRLPIDGTIKANLSRLENIRDFSSEMKKNFIREFKRRHGEFHGFMVDRKKSLKNAFTQDENYLAWLLVILFQAAQTAKVNVHELDEATILEKLQIIAKLFPAPCFLMRNILSKMIGHEDFNIENKKRRKNWYWDYQMLFYISAEKPLIIITKDGDMADAAKDAGLESRIIDLAKYLELLELNVTTSS